MRDSKTTGNRPNGNGTREAEITTGEPTIQACDKSLNTGRLPELERRNGNAVEGSPESFALSRARRCNEYFEHAATAAKEWYNANGEWAIKSMPPETRERYWICFALYSRGESRLANSIILQGKTDRSHMGRRLQHPFDIFHTNIGCLLLKMHRAQMSPEVVEKLEGLVRTGISSGIGNRRPDYQFHGYNDNMPAKATMGLVLGGEMLGDRRAVDHGLWNLTQLRNMLIRRGTISEWNSPTYTALTLHAFAEIAGHAENAEARELAAGIEERLWIDLASRFHPEIGVISGPYSRAYTIDFLAHASCVSALLWFVLGDISLPSPLELFSSRPGLVVHHMGDFPFNIAQMCWLASGTCHPSERVIELFHGKRYPFRAVASAEMGDAGPDFPARPVRIESYLERDFAVGTSSTPFLTGEQAAPYVVTYKRGEHVRSIEDIGTAFYKFAINDEQPGTIVHSVDEKENRHENSGEQDHLASRGNIITLQSGPTVLALTHPHLSLAGLEQRQEPLMINRLNEMIIFPSHFGGMDELLVGKREVAALPADVVRGEWIGFRRGRLLVGIRPLVYLGWTGKIRITVERLNAYEVLRSTFYSGEGRLFTRDELRGVFGGFVAEHASVDEYSSLAEFIAVLSQGKFTDYYWTTRRTRYCRPASDMRAKLEMEVSWSPGSVAPRHALINGMPASRDNLCIDGLSSADFPFAGDHAVSPETALPWSKMDIVLDGMEVHGFIGDREE